MDPVHILSVTFTLGYILQCIFSCHLYHNFNPVYDRLETLEQVTWSQQNPNSNPVYTRTRDTNRAEDPT
jgi:hypothetical protein